jgi:hypothetical protein
MYVCSRCKQLFFMALEICDTQLLTVFMQCGTCSIYHTPFSQPAFLLTFSTGLSSVTPTLSCCAQIPQKLSSPAGSFLHDHQYPFPHYSYRLELRLTDLESFKVSSHQTHISSFMCSHTMNLFI